MQRITANIDDKIHSDLKRLAELQRRTLTDIVAEALEDWSETVGAANIEIAEEKLAAVPA